MKHTVNMTRVGRYLCLILRHKPEAAGITLDEHGWADVRALLRGIADRYPITMEQLEEIVRTDSKSRYSFNEDKTKIRANQGHSIPVDVGLPELAPPEILYHGTGERFLESILAQGLLPMSRLYVHLTDRYDTARTVGARHGTPAVLTILSGQMHRDGYRFYRAVNGVWLTERVPPEYFAG